MDDPMPTVLVGRSPIPIPILGWNGNGPIYLKLNPYSHLRIQIFILIPILVTNQTLRGIRPFGFRFQSILIPIPISIANQVPSKGEGCGCFFLFLVVNPSYRSNEIKMLLVP